ncbi:MAG TPA: type II toxin-antitoxin system death-on-curing family toxin [Gemmatimonadaceae bacterium]|nr:type II toxin-antitoxin system death-on-curing family toxin [Gemmatimonadaceae bacterium]
MSEPAKPAEPRWITQQTLFAIHAQQVERYGGAHGMVDANVVLSALARPINRWSYDPADLADLAAAYLARFARSQGFRDGNRRTALACALVFLALNGEELHVPPAELYALTMAVAENRSDDVTVAAYLRDRLGARRASSDESPPLTSPARPSRRRFS